MPNTHTNGYAKYSLKHLGVAYIKHFGWPYIKVPWYRLVSALAIFLLYYT